MSDRVEERVVKQGESPDLKPGQTLIEYEDLGVQLICSLNTDRDQLLDNIAANLKVDGLSRVWPCQPQPDDVKLAIVAGGPSLEDTLPELQALVADGVNVVSLANSTGWLLDHGINPSAQIVLDAKPRNASFVHDVPGCTYFVASQCDPSVLERVMAFEGVDGHTGPTRKEGSQRVFLFHAVNNQDEFNLINSVDGIDGQWAPVHAGSTITMRGIRLFQILGFSRFHLFGFDSCCMGEKHHAYEQPSADHFLRTTLECNGRPFVVTGWMLHQAMEFMKFAREFGESLDIIVHGDGLIAHMIRSGVERKEAA